MNALESGIFLNKKKKLDKSNNLEQCISIVSDN